MGKAYKDYTVRDVTRLNGAFLQKNESQMEAFKYIASLFSTVTDSYLWESSLLDLFGDPAKKNKILEDKALINEALTTRIAEHEATITNVEKEGYGASALIQHKDALYKLDEGDIDSKIKTQEKFHSNKIRDISDYSEYLESAFREKAKIEKELNQLQAIKAGTLATEGVIYSSVKKILENSFWQLIKVSDEGSYITLSFTSTIQVRQKYVNPMAGLNYDVNFGYVLVKFMLPKNGNSPELKVYPLFDNLNFNVDTENGKYRKAHSDHILPNVSSSGTVCWGTGKTESLEALSNGDFKTVFDNLASLLMTYSDGTPYRNMQSFQTTQRLLNESREKWQAKLASETSTTQTSSSWADMPTELLFMNYIKRRDEKLGLSGNSMGGNSMGGSRLLDYVSRERTSLGEYTFAVPLEPVDEDIVDSGKTTNNADKELTAMLNELRTRTGVTVCSIAHREENKDTLFGFATGTHEAISNSNNVFHKASFGGLLLMQGLDMTDSYHMRPIHTNGSNSTRAYVRDVSDESEMILLSTDILHKISETIIQDNRELSSWDYVEYTLGQIGKFSRIELSLLNRLGVEIGQEFVTENCTYYAGIKVGISSEIPRPFPQLYLFDHYSSGYNHRVNDRRKLIQGVEQFINGSTSLEMLRARLQYIIGYKQVTDNEYTKHVALKLAEITDETSLDLDFECGSCSCDETMTWSIETGAELDVVCTNCGEEQGLQSLHKMVIDVVDRLMD